MGEVPKSHDQTTSHDGAPVTLNTVDVMKGQGVDKARGAGDGKHEPADGSLDLSGITRDKQGRVSQVQNQDSHDSLWNVKYTDDKGTGVQNVKLQETPSDWASIDRQADGSYLIHWNPPRDKTEAPIKVNNVSVDQKTGAVSWDSQMNGNTYHVTWQTNGEMLVDGKPPSLEHPAVWYPTKGK